MTNTDVRGSAYFSRVSEHCADGCGRFGTGLNSVVWCPWPESNQHSLRNSILSRARLPIPPQGHFALSGKAEVAKPAEYSGRGPAVNPRVPGYAEARCRRSAYPSPRWTMIRLRRVPTEPKHSPVKAAARQVPVSATRTDAITQMSFLSLIGNGAVANKAAGHADSLFGDTISC